MDFYINLSSSPTPNLPLNSPTYSKYFFEKAIELNGQYEVALVQSIFKGVHSSRLATLKIYPDSKSHDEFVVHFEAEDGESYESVVRKLNNDLWMNFNSYSYKKFNGTMDIDISLNYQDIPSVKYNKKTHQITIVIPKDWKYMVTDQDKNRMTFLNNEESAKFQFNDSHFYHLRHFYTLSNIVGDQLTGDEPAPILSNFVLNDICLNFASKEFEYPQYVKLSKDYISELTLEYTTDLYKSSFLEGTIISTLHFRPVNGL